MGVVAFLTHIASSSGSTGALCDLVVDIVRYALGAGSGGGDLLCSSLL